MRTFLKISAVLLLVAVIGIAYLFYRGSRLDSEARQYVDETIPLIVEDWNEQALISRATPELLRTAKQEDLDKLFVMFRRLGRLIHYDGAKGQALMSATTREGRTTTASYTAQAEFENAPATISISLVKQGDRWLIQGFRVDSKFFLQ